MLEYEGWTGGITASKDVDEIKVEDNTVAGTWHHGFHFIPNLCDGKETLDGSTAPTYTFTGNYAHSISGYGAIALNVQYSCAEMSSFTGAKCTEASIFMGTQSTLNKASSIVSAEIQSFFS